MSKNASVMVDTPPPTVRFSMGKSTKGLDALNVGQEVTVTVKGKVSSVNQDRYGSGFALENFTVTFPKKSDLRRLG